MQLVAGMPGHETHQRIGGGIVCSAACANVGYGIGELRAEIFADERKQPPAARVKALLESPRFKPPAMDDRRAWNALYELLATFYSRDYCVWAALSKRNDVPYYIRELIVGRASKCLEIYPEQDDIGREQP